MPRIKLSDIAIWRIKDYEFPDVSHPQGRGWLSWYYPTYKQGKEQMPFPDICESDSDRIVTPTVLTLPEFTMAGDRGYGYRVYIRGPSVILTSVDHDNLNAQFRLPKLQGDEWLSESWE